MRWLLSLIFIMVTLSSASAIETRTEYIKEEVCPAIAGCWKNALTGECPDCIIETRKIVTVIKNVRLSKKEKSNFVWEKEDNTIIAKVPRKKPFCIGNCDWVNKKHIWMD